MARVARAKSETGIYHVMLRGIDKRNIFLAEEEYIAFLQYLEKAQEKVEFTTYAYCLMTNYIHLLLKTEEPIGDIIKRIAVGYAQYHNIKNGRTGHLFQNRFKSDVVETDEYFLMVLRYINQNPVKAGIVQDMKCYKWSSYHKYFNENEKTINTEFIQIYFKSIKEFEMFMEEKNDDECLDHNPTKRWVDDELAEYINQVLNINAVIYNGFMFLRYGDRNISGRIFVGYCYILWGIHALDFPFLHTIPWFAPVGFLIGTVLALGTSISTLYYYFEMKNKELLGIEEELKFMSFHDALTGLFNRNYFEQEIKRLESEKRNQKTNQPTGIIICDVDGLKLVNDMFGHERGDLLLTEAAKIIQGVFLQKGLVARIGGDEFAVLLEDNEEGLLQACQDIHQALRLYNAKNPELPLSISVGCAVDHFPFDLTRVFREADNNMYKEKLRQSHGVRDSIVKSLMLALDKKGLSHRRADIFKKLFLV